MANEHMFLHTSYLIKVNTSTAEKCRWKVWILKCRGKISSMKTEAWVKLVAIGGCDPMQSVQLYWCLLVYMEKIISIHSTKT